MRAVPRSSSSTSSARSGETAALTHPGGTAAQQQCQIDQVRREVEQGVVSNHVGLPRRTPVAKLELELELAAAGNPVDQLERLAGSGG